MFLLTMSSFFPLIIFLSCSAASQPEKQAPSLKHSLTAPVVRAEGDDALLTCVVNQQRNYTVLWKRDEKDKAGSRILTANGERVTSDERISVLHEEGGEVYVLLVKNVTRKDVGLYICEVNSDPPLRSFHQIKILSDTLSPPESTLVAPHHNSTPELAPAYEEPSSLSAWGYSTNRPIQHDYTQCCIGKNVSTACLGFCNLKAILDGEATSNPVDCEADFPEIASCMADGRDHMPCCEQAGIPPVCTDLCRGEYTVQTDLLKTHFSCAAFTAPTLACIAAGIDLLPGPPEEMSATALDDSTIQIQWSPPRTDPQLTRRYVINITYHQMLSPVYSVTVVSNKAKQFYPPFSRLHSVLANQTSFTLKDLEKFSLYEVVMWTEGVSQGKSLPTYSAQVVTHVPGERAQDLPAIAPKLPDIKSCCLAKNVSHAQCVDTFCDPIRVSDVSVADMIVCAPWDTQMFSCLADGKDHSPCCSAKRMPPICQELCSGKVTDINFQYFKCLSYMSEMSSCLLEGYGVLPSAPVNFRFSNVDTTFSILHWERPEVLGDSVVHYRVTFQEYSADGRQLVQEIGELLGTKQSIDEVFSPFILENLNRSTTYEVYVEAVNEYGIGEESSRVVFRTASRTMDDLEKTDLPYNQTECCVHSEILPECLPLCSYNAKMSDVEKLGLLCLNEFSKIMRCAVGGRDHLPCCSRRGVPKSCQPLCQAVHQSSTGAEFSQCLPFIGQVFTCLEEGTAILPPPVRELRAVEVKDGEVSLAWKYDDVNGNVNTSHFEVYYKKIDINSTQGTVFSSDNQINSTVPRAVVQNLEAGTLYRFFVVSRNDKGTSLPSSIVRVNVTGSGWDGKEVKGATSPPHLLELQSHSATWLQFTWNPPAVTHPEDVLKYRMFYKQASNNASQFMSVETDVTTVKLQNLTPNTQYVLYVTAVTMGSDETSFTLTNTTAESEPSETVISWTDPAFPAFVEAPTIHPINKVTEGSDMTVLCIAMGTPMPTVTLYVNGHPIRSEVTRHMVTVLHNVTKDMGQVSCFADNGYGTPMQASRHIIISRAPTVFAPMETEVTLGDELILRCRVDAYPAPTMAVFRDHTLKDSVSSDDHVTISATGSAEDPASFTLELRINSVEESDARKYYCHANNTQGESVAPMGVKIGHIPKQVKDVKDCCRTQNVSKDCLDICTFSIDFDTMLRKPYCIPEFNKFMHCASDGSDHRHCCNNAGVPADCINWCRGQPTENSDVCAISHSKSIIGCFHEGNKQLPGPPRNIIVRPKSESSAMVQWDAPEKNPEAVELYRVYWRPSGSRDTAINDTTETKMKLTNLVGGTTYEVVVKAGNSHGTSHLTAPLRFITGDEVIIETSKMSSGASQVVGIIIAVLVVSLVVLAVIIFMKKKNIVLSVKKPSSPTIAFENPFYSSRDNQNTGQVADVSTEDISSSESWQGEMAVRSSIVPEEQEREHNPAFLPNLGFGRAGQGFQRFK